MHKIVTNITIKKTKPNTRFKRYKRDPIYAKYKSRFSKHIMNQGHLLRTNG